jgi:predicted HTH domain antitoxin
LRETSAQGQRPETLGAPIDIRPVLYYRSLKGLTMQMTLTVPDAANISETDAQILFAIKLFEAEKLSLGKAAETAGLSYRTFYELLVRYGVPVVSYNEEETRAEIENAHRRFQ